MKVEIFLRDTEEPHLTISFNGDKMAGKHKMACVTGGWSGVVDFEAMTYYSDRYPDRVITFLKARMS